MNKHHDLCVYDEFVPAWASKGVPEYLETFTSREVSMVLDRALTERLPVIVRGVVGVGKTEILQKYEYWQHFRIVTAIGGKQTERVILENFCRVHGIEPHKVGARHCFSAIVEALTDDFGECYGRPVVVDEAHFVEPDGFRSLLEIAMIARVPAIFFGNEDTARHKTTSKAQWSQINDRVAIDKFIPGLHAKDIEAFADHYGVQGSEALLYLQQACAKQSLRGLKRVLEAAKFEAGQKRSIGLREIKEAVSVCHSEKQDSGFFSTSKKPLNIRAA